MYKINLVADKGGEPLANPGARVHQLNLGILEDYKLGSIKCITQNDLHQSYQSKRVIILIETKLTNHKCFHVKSQRTPDRAHSRRTNPFLKSHESVPVQHCWWELESRTPLFGRERDLLSYKPERASTTTM